MKILLTHGYFLRDDPAEKTVMKPYPPLGILCLSAWLSKEGIENEVYDSTFSSFGEMIAFLDSCDAKIIGFYATLMTRLNILKVINHIKEHPSLHPAYIIIGGPDARYNAKEWLESGADIVIPGEGEVTLTETWRSLSTSGKDNLSETKGIIFRDDQLRVIDTQEREPLKPGLIPQPDYHAIHIESYREAWKKYHWYYSLSINTMRGCPYSCDWCSKSVYGDTYRRKDPEDVVEEIRDLTEKYHPDRLWFTDDVFTISREWLKKFTATLATSQTVIRYECISRTDCIDDEIILLLKRSGCEKIWIGAESGSQKVLDLMNRRTSIRDTINLMKRLHEAGIMTGTFLMAGYPGETKKDILLTAQYLKEARPDEFTLTLAYPIRGTRFFLKAEPHFMIPYDWERMPEKEIRFKRNYSHRFYFFALRYLYNSSNAAKATRISEKTRFGMKALLARIFLMILK